MRSPDHTMDTTGGSCERGPCFQLQAPVMGATQPSFMQQGCKFSVLAAPRAILPRGLGKPAATELAGLSCASLRRVPGLEPCAEPRSFPLFIWRWVREEMLLFNSYRLLLLFLFPSR